MKMLLDIHVSGYSPAPGAVNQISDYFEILQTISALPCRSIYCTLEEQYRNLKHSALKMNSSGDEPSS